MIQDNTDSSHRRGLFGMAQPSSGYLTEDAYIEHRWAQDDLIRKEFEKHHNHVEAHHRELRNDLDTVKSDVGQLKIDVKELKEDVRQLKVDVAELKVDFQRMQGRMYNQSIRNLFIRITPIGVYRPGIGLVMPTDFPKNAHDFWKLRAPRNSSQSTFS
jgi:polyhydroxyalkanoate synthesis regulator phasin